MPVSFAVPRIGEAVVVTVYEENSEETLKF